jgi:hypothetical protein
MALKICVNFPLDTFIEDPLDFTINAEALESAFDLFFPMATETYDKFDPMIKMIVKQFVRNAIYKIGSGSGVSESVKADLKPENGEDPIIHTMRFVRKYMGTMIDAKDTTINLIDNGNREITALSLTTQNKSESRG